MNLVISTRGESSFLQESTHEDGYTIANRSCRGRALASVDSANIHSFSLHGTLQSGTLSGFTGKENEAHSYPGVKLGSKRVLSLHFAIPLWSHSQPTPKACWEHNSHTSPFYPILALLASSRSSSSPFVCTSVHPCVWQMENGFFKKKALKYRKMFFCFFFLKKALKLND